MQNFAGIMLAAAHLHQIGIGAEIARAHFRAGLEAAGAENHRAAADLIFFVRIGHSDAVDMPVVAEQSGDLRLVAQLDAHLGRDRAPLHELIETAADSAGRVNDHARLEVVAAVDDDVAVDVPFDADLAHPVDRRGRLRYQDVGQFFIDPPAGHALQVAMKLFGRVGRNMKFREHGVIHVRQELANLFGAGKYPAKTGVREARIAAEFRLRRFFEHHHFRRARLFGRDRRLERGAATADHDHRDVFSSQSWSPRLDIAANAIDDTCQMLNVFLRQALNKARAFELVHERVVDKIFDAHLGDLGVELSQKLLQPLHPF